MSPMTARAVSMALWGGLVAAFFSSGGLLDWAAFIAWAGFLAAGGDNAALKKTIPAFIFGAAVAWAAMLLRHQVAVAPDSILWIPRAGFAAAGSILILVLVSKVDLLSSVAASLTGFALAFAAGAIPIQELKGESRVMGVHMYNPFFQVSISMVAGVLVGLIAVKTATALQKK